MFEEIKKKYPKAWEKFLKCYYSEFLVQFPNADLNRMWKIDPTKNLKSQIGHLFTFFDEQRIYIVLQDFFLTEERKTIIKWTVGHYDKDGHTLTDQELYNKQFESRPEAWQAAFTKAFEILESK